MPKIRGAKQLFDRRKGNSKKPTEPMWKGPQVDGITQSLLSRFLVCRERFRLLVIEGLQPADTFSHRIEYGHMWHACCESANNQDDWLNGLRQCCMNLCKKYPLQQERVNHWYNVCKIQFGVYWDKGYMKRENVGTKKKTIMSEKVFAEPYKLPSGRQVILRGKWDGVTVERRECCLFEHKTKGEADEGQIKRQLKFDLQTMLYVTALESHMQKLRVSGIDYNVVRRPLSGGKGSIGKHKPTKKKPQGESDVEFYARLRSIIEEDPDYFFMHFRVTLTKEDINKFRREFLNPILEQLCDWWEWITAVPEHPFYRSCSTGLHYRTPFGFYNVLAEGGHTEVDEYLETGDTIGLVRVNNLFSELS